MTLSFLGTWFPHIENKSILTALDRLLVADSQTNMWNHKQISFAQFQAIVASNVESVNGLTGIVSLGLTDLDDIPDPTTGSTFLSWNGSAFVWAGGWVGETNLADNVGSGANIWKDKTGVTFNFRGINGIQGIAAVVNSDNIDINFDVASLTAGQKTALVAATATEMAAAIDLTDLGDVTITTPSDGQVLTWNGSAWVNEDLPSSSGGFNINSLSLVTTANVTNDFVAIYSAALAAHKKISITNLLTLAGFTGDIYFKVSSSDTTPGYGATKLTATDGIKRTIVNPTAAESISFTLDYENLAAASTPATATSLLAIFDDDETYKKLTLDELFALDLTHLLKAGWAMTGALLEAKWTNKASASTVDLSTATGNLIHITGTTTITSFGIVQAGATFKLVFDWILTLTHHATSLILGNAGSNITTAVGDTMIISSEWAGNWRMIDYTRADGTSLISTSYSSDITDLKKVTYTLGESFTGATTPEACVVIDDLYQPLFVGIQRLGTVSSWANYAQRRALKIIPRTTTTSTSIYALIGKNNAPSDNIRITVQGDSAWSPDNTPITNGTSNNIAGSAVSSSQPTWTAFTFASAFTLTAGTTYWIVVERTGAMSDTDHYWLWCGHDTKDYASFDGKSYVSNWNNASLELPTIKIIPTTGWGKSLWKTQSNHSSYMMRQCMGFCVTTGSAGADGIMQHHGLIAWFTGLAKTDYFASSTPGWFTSAVDGINVGEWISTTQILLPHTKKGALIELWIVSTSSIAVSSMANCVWMAHADWEILLTNSNNSSTVTNLTVTIFGTTSKVFYMDDDVSGYRSTLTVPVHKWQLVMISHTSNGTIDTVTYIPHY